MSLNIGDEGLRRRNVPAEADRVLPDATTNSVDKVGDAIQKSDTKLPSETFWLTRIVLLRYVAFIYCVAFMVAYNQNSALIGKNGLLPADAYIKRIQQHAGDSIWDQLKIAPTLLLIFTNYDVDVLLRLLSATGFVISFLIVIFGCANVPLMLMLWVAYHSIINVGQRWYSFGWESQLLETGFLAAFLCPLWSLRRFPEHTPTPSVILWAFRWLIFRIMLGAGLIKIRGDQCWLDLTCMNYHYETQPVPNPISYYMHKEPVWFHQFETMANHFVELVAPLLLFLTRRPRIIGGIIQILFQVTLIISGNLSFLNWLTIVPCLACFDDSFLSWLFSASAKKTVIRLSVGEHLHKHWGSYVRRVFNVFFALLLAYLSIPIVQNLLSSRQVMNTSFDPLRLVNTYGAFGTVTKERTEVIFQGTYASNPNDPSANWYEYEFMCKPGNITRRPCFISPYHYRLDWLMWFAAFQNYQHNPWIVHLAVKFLTNDETVLPLIAHNPFQGREPPKWVRAEHYKYAFTKLGSKAAKNGAWWSRHRIGPYMPPLSLDTVQNYAKSMGWKLPQY
jgi:hypothetical protein